MNVKTLSAKNSFYRFMLGLYAERGIATVSRLSIRLSACNIDVL